MLIQAFTDWSIFLVQEAFFVKLWQKLPNAVRLILTKQFCTIVRILAIVHPLGSCFLCLQILSGQNVALVQGSDPYWQYKKPSGTSYHTSFFFFFFENMNKLKSLYIHFKFQGAFCYSSEMSLLFITGQENTHPQFHRQAHRIQLITKMR